MNNRFFLFLFSVLIILSWTPVKKSKPNQGRKILPEGAFPINYRGHIYIEGGIDGLKGNFVFDTGADNLYFDSLFYVRSSFKPEKIVKAKLPGAGNTPQDVIVILDSLLFQFHDETYLTSIIPVLKLKPILGDFADGIIGSEYFMDKVLQINYEDSYARVFKSISTVDTANYSRIQLEFTDKRFFIPLELDINDTVKIEGRFLLDFGAGGSISLTSSAASAFNLSDVIENKVKYFSKYGGIGGESSSYAFRAKSLSVLDYQLDSATMDYSIDTAGALSSKKHFGLLGNEILDRFDILLNFKTNTLFIKPNGNYAQPFKFSRLGFSYVDRNITKGGWFITGFYDNSPASLSGLKIDDKVTHVNDMPVNETSYEDQKDLFKTLNKIKVTVKREDKVIDFRFKLKEVIES
ncbi:MAG: PDZ domain-containing protein [Bacteroidales bacterium]